MADANDALVKQLGELFSREDKKSIPIFKRSSDEKLVTDWLREAERIANNNEWDDSQKLKFFPDRFKDEAADWHASYIEEHNNPSYADWKKDFINRFRDEADLDNLKNKLQNLTQKPDQRTRAFVAKLNSLYDGVYGKEPTISAGATQEARAMNNTIKRMRSKAKRKIFLKG